MRTAQCVRSEQLARFSDIFSGWEMRLLHTYVFISLCCVRIVIQIRIECKARIAHTEIDYKMELALCVCVCVSVCWLGNVSAGDREKNHVTMCENIDGYRSSDFNDGD